MKKVEELEAGDVVLVLSSGELLLLGREYGEDQPAPSLKDRIKLARKILAWKL